jgi:transposase-like protein
VTKTDTGGGGRKVSPYGHQMIRGLGELAVAAFPFAVLWFGMTPEKRLRRHLRPNTGSWRVDETYIKVKGVWTYLYRAVDSLGRTRRNAASAKRFFRKAQAQVHTVNPRTITVDKNPAYPRTTAEMRRGRKLWRFAALSR